MLSDAPTSHTVRQRQGRRHKGFSLLEMLVTLAILGMLAGSVSLALPDPAASTREESLRAWQKQLAWCARRARAEGQPWAWVFSDRDARLQVREQDLWRSPDHSMAETLLLAPGLRIVNSTINGIASGNRGRIVFAGPPPIFQIDLISENGQRWRLQGRASGQITLEAS